MFVGPAETFNEIGLGWFSTEMTRTSAESINSNRTLQDFSICILREYIQSGDYIRVKARIFAHRAKVSNKPVMIDATICQTQRREQRLALA